MRARQPGRRGACSASAFGFVFALLLAGLHLSQTTRADAAPAVQSAPAAKALARRSPPSSVSDIVALLDAERPEDPKAHQRLVAQADALPPEGTDAKTLARFYFERGIAARRTGRVRQTIADLRRAHALSPEMSGRFRFRVLRMLALAEINAGDYRSGMAYLRQAIETTTSRPRKTIRLASYAVFAARFGSLAEARRVLGDAERTMERVRTSSDRDARKDWRRFGTRMRARVYRARATISFVEGRLDDAERIYRASFALYRNYYDAVPSSKKFDERGIRYLRNHVQADIAAALLRQGRPIEAEIEIREALLDQIAITGQYDRRVARFAGLLADALRAEGRAADAEALARRTIVIMQRIGAAPDSRGMYRARIALADSLAAQNRWDEALGQYEIAHRAMALDPQSLGSHLNAGSSHALALLKNGRIDEALDLARLEVDRQGRRMGADNPLTANARGVLAMALAAVGRDRQAMRAYAAATPMLLARRAQTDRTRAHAVRDREFALILDSQVAFLARQRGTALETELGIDAVAEAFRLSDVLRGRTLQRALDAGAARAAARDPDLAGLVRRAQDAAHRLEALEARYVDLLGRPGTQRDVDALRSLTSALAEQRRRHAALAEEITRRFPEYDALVNPRPPTIARARRALTPDEALIAIHVGETESYVWALRNTGPFRFAVAPIGAAGLAGLVDQLRRGVTARSSTLAGIPAFDVDAAHRVYAALLAPVADVWRDARELIIVPDGALTRLPFSMLVSARVVPRDGAGPLFSGYREVPWLVRTHGAAVLPTVSSLLTLRRATPPPPARRPFVGFADPWFASSADEAAAPGVARRGTLAALPRLPGTALEVRSIAAALKADPARDLFIGPRANEQRVRSAGLDRYAVVAFASHALAPGDLDGLTQPALALTSPSVAGIAGDGLLAMNEILGLELDADWVVLSACNTAGGGGRGAEAVSGLGRAFLYAGARALMVSHWPVETASARQIVTDLFRRYAARPELSRSQALRLAMLAMIDGSAYRDREGETLFSYAHPLFWAPFSLFGDGRGRVRGSGETGGSHR